MNFRWGYALLLVAACAIAQERPPQELIAGADVKIASDGAVVACRLDGRLDPPIADALQREVWSWHFEPAQVDGRAVEAKTHVSVTLQPKEVQPGSFAWQITDVSIGQPALARRALLMPDYPLAALRAHLGARVVVVLKLAPTGKVEAVHAEQTSLTSPGNDKLASQWREIFEDVTLRVAKGWKFHPVETVDGAAVGTSIRIPIVFLYYADRVHRYYPGPIVPAPWLAAEPAESAAARDALADGQIQPLDSHVHLRDDVVGHVL